MQTQLSDGKKSSNILYKPAHLLAFIKHVLDPGPPQRQNPAKSKNPLRFDDLHTTEVDDELLDEGDSDDDAPGSEVVGVDHEMIDTALNLLLSILEGIMFSMFLRSILNLR